MKNPEEIKQKAQEPKQKSNQLNKRVEKHLKALQKLRQEKETIETGLAELEQVFEEQYKLPREEKGGA
jgi:chaperonin cofactor prefoldin